jgi:peptidoglycan/LPS O-acetylase OafA/YrhL
MIKPLTSFRFIAALAVLFSHLGFFANHEALKPVYDRLFYEGYLGVSFFFLLSGFILTYNYMERIKGFNNQGLGKYYISRVARIYPVHLATFLCALALDLIGNPNGSLMKAVLNITLLQGFVPDQSIFYSYNGVSWSLSNEMFFYLLFPMLLVLARRAEIWRHWSAIASGMLILWITAAIPVFFVQQGELAYWFFKIFPLYRIGEFMIGMLLGMLFLHLKERGEAIRKAWFSWMEAGAVALFIAMIWLYPSIHAKVHYDSILYVPVFSALIFIFAYQRGIVSALVSGTCFVFLGEISYSMYMVHGFIISIVIHQTPFEELYPLVTAGGIIVISIAVSALLYWIVEVPSRRRINQWYDRIANRQGTGKLGPSQPLHSLRGEGSR